MYSQINKWTQTRNGVTAVSACDISSSTIRCVAAALLLAFFVGSTAQATTQCYQFRANVGQVTGVLSADPETAEATTVASCNSSMANWTACYAANVGQCNGNPDYICSGV